MNGRRVLAAATVLGLVGAGGVWAGVAATSNGTTAPAAPHTALARVVRADLAEQQAIPGTIGYDGQYTIFGPAGTAAQLVTQAQQSLTADGAALAADQTALNDTGATNGQAIGQQEGALTNVQAVAGADQTQAQLDKTQEAADQHGLAVATTKRAGDQAQLASDTASQRSLQQVQLADQQQLSATQTRVGADQSTTATATQQVATDQRTLQADTQTLSGAQQALQGDTQTETHDCGIDPNSSQCGADVSRVAADNQSVSTDQQQVAVDQAAVTHDQNAAATDQTTLANDQAAEAAIQQRLNGEAVALQQVGFALTDDGAVAQQDATTVNATDAALTADKAKVAADQAKVDLADPAAVSTAQATLAVARVTAVHNLHQAQAKLDGDTIALQSAQAALDTAQRTAVGSGTTLTWLPHSGQAITQGQPVYAVDGAAVPLLYGQVPLFRDLHGGATDGADIGELNADLGLPPSNHFSAATTAALQRWQSAAGLPPAGTLTIGQAVIEPGPFVVGAVHASVGTPIGSGAILDATSPVLVVTAQVPLSDLGSVTPGDAVTVDLPDGHSGVTGRVRDIGTAVTPAPGGSNGQGGQGGQSGQTPVTSAAATVTFSDATVAHGLDQAAVLVHVTTQTARGVLAVPVDALLALAGGDEGLEIVTGNQHRVIPVTTGVFTGTQVQIDGAGITEGTQVEVPAP